MKKTHCDLQHLSNLAVIGAVFIQKLLNQSSNTESHNTALELLKNSSDDDLNDLLQAVEVDLIPTIQLLTLDEVLKALKCSKTKLYNGIYEGTFPPPIPKLKDERQSLWNARDIKMFLQDRVNGDITSGKYSRKF